MLSIWNIKTAVNVAKKTAKPPYLGVGTLCTA